MKTRRFKLAALAGLALLVVATAVMAVVTIDPVEGTGFVGKGDVQLALGMNNNQLQRAVQDHGADAFTFSYQSVTTWDVTVEWWTGPSHNRTRHENVETFLGASIVSEVEYDARTQNQVNGFILKGWPEGGPTIVEGGTVPEVGDIWKDKDQGNNPDKTVIAVEQAGAATGGLYVQYLDGEKVLLPNQ